MRPKLHAGTTGDCLADFGRRFPMATDQLAQFAGVGADTVIRWLNSDQWPRGMALLKARVFLDAHGYAVREFDSLPEKNKILARLIGFDLVDLEETAVFLQYTTADGVYELVLRGGGVSPQRDTLLNQLIREHREQLNQAIATLQEGYMSIQNVETQPVQPAPKPSRPVSSWLDTSDEAVELAAGLVNLARRTREVLSRPDADELLRSLHLIISTEEVGVLVKELERLRMDRVVH